MILESTDGNWLLWVEQHAVYGLAVMIIWASRNMILITRTIYGGRGEEGLVVAVKRVRDKVHEHSTEIATVHGRLGFHDQELDQIREQVTRKGRSA